MKYLSFFFIFLLINNCSLNSDSQYWTKDHIKKKNYQKKLSKIKKKAQDITTMKLEEYKIYIDDYTKKSKYPNITQ